MLRVGLHRNNFNYCSSLKRYATYTLFLYLNIQATVLRTSLNKKSIRAVIHNGETEQVLRDPSHLQRTEEPTHHLLAH